MNLAKANSPFVPKKIRRMTFEAFYKKYEKGLNGYKYEWNNGVIEKTTAMKQNELYIIDNLLDLFFSLGLNKQGKLVSEIEVYTSETQWRKPDLAFFTKAQISEAAQNVNTIPAFVIEVISTHDPINTVTNKVSEYFKAGVQTLWHIFPEQQLVYIFTSPKHITVCEGDDMCSAAPALPIFQIAAKDIFLQ